MGGGAHAREGPKVEPAHPARSRWLIFSCHHTAARPAPARRTPCTGRASTPRTSTPTSSGASCRARSSTCLPRLPASSAGYERIPGGHGARVFRTLTLCPTRISLHCQNDRVQYKCRCSYVEIYNEVIYDLLDVAGNVCRTRTSTSPSPLAVHDALTDFFDCIAAHSHPRGQPPRLPRERHRGPAHVDRRRLRGACCSCCV